MAKKFETTKNTNKDESKTKENADSELDLEIVELEEKIAPRNWMVYSII